MNSHLLPLFISCRSSGEKSIKYQIKITSSKLILFDHVPDSHDHSILQSIDITGRKLTLITLKKVYTLYVFMYSSILRIFVKNYENLVAITLSLLINELKFQITRLSNISFSWDESRDGSLYIRKLLAFYTWPLNLLSPKFPVFLHYNFAFFNCQKNNYLCDKIWHLYRLVRISFPSFLFGKIVYKTLYMTRVKTSWTCFAGACFFLDYFFRK